MDNNNNVFERLFKLWTVVSEMAIRRSRDPEVVVDALWCFLIDKPQHSSFRLYENHYERLLRFWHLACGQAICSSSDSEALALVALLQRIVNEPALTLVAQPNWWETGGRAVAEQGRSSVREHLAGKFVLLADLGIIEVPRRVLSLDGLRRRHQDGKKKTFDVFRGDITDANFVTASHAPMSGDRLHVRAWKQNAVSGTTMPEERLAFAKGIRSLLPGSQAVPLIVDLKRDELPRNYFYTFLDEPEMLPLDGSSQHQLLTLEVTSTPRGVVFNLDFDFFEIPMGEDSVFFSFHDQRLDIAV